METTQASLDHLTRENPMGEARKDALRLDFDRNGGEKWVLDTCTRLFGGFWHDMLEFSRQI